MYEINLRNLLKKKGITQKEFAEMVGIGENTVSKWANNNVNDVNLALLYKICKALNITDINEMIVDDGRPLPEEEPGQTAVAA